MAKYYALRDIYHYTWRELGWGEYNKRDFRKSRDLKSEFEWWRVEMIKYHAHYSLSQWKHNRESYIKHLRLSNATRPKYAETIIKRLFKPKSFFATMDYFFNHLSDYERYLSLLRRKEAEYIHALNNPQEKDLKVILQRIVKDSNNLARILYAFKYVKGYYKIANNSIKIDLLHNNVFGLKTMKLSHTILTLGQIKALLGLWRLWAETSRNKARFKGALDTNAKVAFSEISRFLANPQYYDSQYSVFLDKKTYRSLWL